MEPGSSLVPAEKRGATHGEGTQDAPTPPDVVGVPWGGPEFLHLLALYAGSFIATCSIILGAWYLVLRPEPQSPDDLRSTVREEVRDALSATSITGVYAGRLGEEPVSFRIELTSGGELSGFVQRRGEEVAATGTQTDDAFTFVETGTGWVWTGTATEAGISGTARNSTGAQGTFKVER
ncbi:MAG: hypothetical protein KC912_17050 [Proteobacteria bacterium]|nr:hypothetical protein [Pseudomonadota bacterium]